MDKVVIIDYGSGNIRSVYNAISSAISLKTKCKKVVVSYKSKEINNCSHIILPGVGSFKGCLSGFYKKKGLYETLVDNVLVKNKPFLGICVGMQMLAEDSYEGGQNKGFGWVEGKVELLDSKNKTLKIPHIGWNNLKKESSHSFIDFMMRNKNIFSKREINAYFVHSYCFKVKNNSERLITTSYGDKITAMIGKRNLLGTQFHPEKSDKFGQKLLKDFLTWEGK